MEPEESVEINRSIATTTARLGNRDGRAHLIVIALAEWHHYVQAVHRAALKQHHHFLFIGRCRGCHRTLKKRWQRCHAEHGDPTVLQKISTGDVHCPFLQSQDPSAAEIPALREPARRSSPHSPVSP